MNPEIEELTKIYLELKDRGVLKKFYIHIKERIK